MLLSFKVMLSLRTGYGGETSCELASRWGKGMHMDTAYLVGTESIQSGEVKAF